ncbi:MAG: hypothetical protein LBD27_00725, partial [Tannerella sp.]|nr:hypothetical protein [Tannerella sp.]
MRKYFFISVFGLIAGFSLLLSCAGRNTAFHAIENGFRSVPDSIRIGCYWYWISDNISKDAVVRDLEAMKT